MANILFAYHFISDTDIQNWINKWTIFWRESEKTFHWSGNACANIESYFEEKNKILRFNACMLKSARFSANIFKSPALIFDLARFSTFFLIWRDSAPTFWKVRYFFLNMLALSHADRRDFNMQALNAIKGFDR